MFNILKYHDLRNNTVNTLEYTWWWMTTKQVGYNIVGWLDKNKDPINQSVVDLLKESKELLVPVFFSEPAEGYLL